MPKNGHVHSNTPIASLGKSVEDFWTWAYGDLFENRNRSIFAEFIVASALGISDLRRLEWNAYDLEYKQHRIEVKSSAYLQNWKQETTSKISFDIAPKRSWLMKANRYSKERTRLADIYVFSVFTGQDRHKDKVENLSLWEFYILTKKRINSELGTQKKLSIGPLKEMADITSYDKLKSEIDRLIHS